MKKWKFFMFAVIFAAFFLSASCMQNPENDGNKPKVPNSTPGSSGESGSGSTPGTTGETVELKLEDLLSAFSLTKGEITASDAAKKIAVGTTAAAGLTFTEKKIIFYDDKAGTFTVEVKGKKDGKSFSNKITAEGFTHPYKSAPTAKNAGDKLKLAAALEDNLKPADFIDLLKNAANASDYLDLGFTLENGKTIDFKNSANPYKLTASFVSNGSKIELTPKYELIYKKLTESGTEETENVLQTAATSAFHKIEYDYFTENDVFEYVAQQVKEDILKVPADTFASSIYAGAKYANTSPGDIFNVGDGSKFKKYQETYKKDGGYIQIVEGDGTSALSYALYNPKNGGIQADDYSGTIKADFYVQRTNFIADTNAGTYSGTYVIKPVHVEKTGFMTVSKEFLRKNFSFNLVKYGDKTEAQKKWLKRQFNNQEILGGGNTEALEPKNLSLIDYEHHHTDDYCLVINVTETNLANYLAVKSKWYVSIANSKGTEYQLLITSIRMEKIVNKKDLALTFSFEGTGEPIRLTLSPVPWD